MLKIGSPTSHRHGAEGDGIGDWRLRLGLRLETETAASVLDADCKLSAANVGLWEVCFRGRVSVGGKCRRVVVSSQGTGSASSGFPWALAEAAESKAPL